MCRILYMETKTAVDPQPLLKSFAEMACHSPEFQGHGWGCAWWAGNRWDFYWSIRPVWEDDFAAIPPTGRLMVHARSAFRDQGIAIQNNMPFVNNNTVFVFNGELHGVKINMPGRIGAEKIFNFILRFYKGSNLKQAAQKAISIIEARTRYIRALNFIVADEKATVLGSHFNEQPDYFTLHLARSEKQLIVCSEPLNIYRHWQTLANKFVEEISL